MRALLGLAIVTAINGTCVPEAGMDCCKCLPWCALVPVCLSACPRLARRVRMPLVHE